jgi:hypothetical protein
MKGCHFYLSFTVDIINKAVPPVTQDVREGKEKITREHIERVLDWAAETVKHSLNIDLVCFAPSSPFSSSRFLTNFLIVVDE